MKPAPAQGGTPAGSRTFRRDWAIVYYGMRFPRSAPGKSSPIVQIRHRQTTPAAAPCRASQLSPRPLPTLETRLQLCIKGVRRARYGPTQPDWRVVGCRLWLLAPLRARGITPFGQVSRSQGGLWVIRSRSARFSSVKHARTHTHTHAHTHTHTHSHTQTHTYRCAGGSYPSHPTSSVHLDIDLLCTPNGIAESGIFRMAPRDACPRL